MNNNLNVFKNMTEEEKKKEVERIEEIFPSHYPSIIGGKALNRRDKANLYIGRIISLLDEFGETDKWAEYAGYACLDTIIKNYEKLILRYLKEYRPEIYSYYIDYHGIEE